MSIRHPDLAPERRTLADDVYEAVKARVMDHVLAPGARVTIDTLARDLTVSPTPVREALARLEADGLMRKRPMSGYTTTPLLTRAEFEQLFAMRELLEVTAARWAAGRPGDAAELRAAARLPEREPDGTAYHRYAEFTAHDARFHDLVAERSGNPMLAEAIGRLHAHLHLHRLYPPDGPLPGTGDEHGRVAAAIVARDPDGAAAAMSAHLASARRRHLAAYDGGGRHNEPNDGE